MTIAEFWKERYDVVVAEKKALGDKLKETLGENESLHNVVDRFVDKCKELEDKAEGYKKERDEKIELLNAVQDRFTKADLETQLKDMTQRYENTRLMSRTYKERLDKSIDDRAELQADRDIWFRKNGEKQAEIEELKKKIESLEADLEFKALCRDGWRDRAEQAERQLEEKKKQSYADGYSDGNEEGQNELWEMLQLVKDMGPDELDPEYDCLGDVIDMDLEDFKEAYSKWEEEKKNVEFMRDYLKKFCVGKLCFGCPLYDTSKPVTSCLFSKLTDKEVEERYRKVIENRDKKITAPISARLPQPWECTIEAKVEINKDLLEKVCGVKSDEEAPHRLEYGDAVRLPWRDYDYMYIGPDEKEETFVRLFDPKNHAVVTTHGSNVRYNGGRILICEEDDIRKIWKYMK